jgi:phage terminase large subunit-like protein
VRRDGAREVTLRINRDALEGLSPGALASVEAELARLERLLERNPSQGFRPHPKQHTFLKSRDRVKAFFGGNQSGKTTAGVEDDIIQCVDRDSLPRHLRQYKQYEPPFYCRIGTPDLGKTMGAVQEKIKEWVPKDQLKGGGWDAAYAKADRVLHFTNGSFIEFMSYDQDRDQWGSATRHRVHYDEEPPETLRNEGHARILHYGGDEIFTMTPLEGMTWMFDAIWEKRFTPGFTVVQVDMDDNPHLDETAKKAYLDGLSEEERRMRKSGQFVHIGGLVLAEFDEDLHVIDPIRADDLRGHVCVNGIDPGIVRGGVVFCSFDRDDTMLVFDELYPQNWIVERTAFEIALKNAEYLNGTRMERKWALSYLPDMVAQGLVDGGDMARIVQLLSAPIERQVMYVIDPSARNRSHINADNVEAAYQRCGIMVTPGQNDLQTGAFQLKRRLQRRPVPALLISRKCVNWLWERSRWKRKPTDDDSFAVVPGDDHVLDPTRYVAQTRWFGPAIEVKKERHNGYAHGRVEPWEYEETSNDTPPMGEWS